MFGSLFNVVLTGCRELPPCNSCLDVIPTELSEWRNPPKRKQTSYGRGFLRALRLVEMTLLGLTTARYYCRGNSNNVGLEYSLFYVFTFLTTSH